MDNKLQLLMQSMGLVALNGLIFDEIKSKIKDNVFNVTKESIDESIEDMNCVDIQNHDYGETVVDEINEILTSKSIDELMQLTVEVSQKINDIYNEKGE